MNTKARIQQLEKQNPKPHVKMTWKEFIESDGEEAETKAAWIEFIIARKRFIESDGEPYDNKIKAAWTEFIANDAMPTADGVKP